MPGDPDANRELVTRFFGALSQGRFDDAESIADSGGTWSIPRKRQVGTIRGQIELMRTEHMRFVVGTLTAEDDRVAAIVEGTMHQPTGGVLEKSYHFLIRALDGRIVDVCMYDDGGLQGRAATCVTGRARSTTRRRRSTG